MMYILLPHYPRYLYLSRKPERKSIFCILSPHCVQIKFNRLSQNKECYKYLSECLYQHSLYRVQFKKCIGNAAQASTIDVNSVFLCYNQNTAVCLLAHHRMCRLSFPLICCLSQLLRALINSSLLKNVCSTPISRMSSSH